MEITIIITVEAKDEFAGPDYNWREGELPKPQQAATRISDVLSDATKHDETIGWRVTNVRTPEQ
jgi:hypothetical protein